MASIEALIRALQPYEGTILFVSHDVYFIRSIATSVLHIRNGILKFYPGDYDYYLEKSEAASEQTGLIAAEAHPKSERGLRSRDRERKRFEAEERQARSRTRSALERELFALEKRILYLEGRQKELVGMLEDQQGACNAQRAVEINQELRATIGELTSLSPEWDRLVDATQSL
jgi:ATP-binding cassette subfamily F protein 3